MYGTPLRYLVSKSRPDLGRLSIDRIMMGGLGNTLVIVRTEKEPWRHVVYMSDLVTSNIGNKYCSYETHEIYGNACYKCCDDCNCELHTCINCGVVLNHNYQTFDGEDHRCYDND